MVFCAGTGAARGGALLPEGSLVGGRGWRGSEEEVGGGSLTVGGTMLSIPWEDSKVGIEQAYRGDDDED